MFGVFRQMSVPKFSARTLRWIFRYGQCIGVIFFCLQKESKGGDKVSVCRWMKWLSLTHRLVTYCRFFYSGSAYQFFSSHRVAQFLHASRLFLSIPIVLFISGYQIFRSPEIIELVNKFLHLFWQVRILFKPERIGFGGRRELILILISSVCLIHELTYLWFTTKEELSWSFFLNWWCDAYVVGSTNMFIHINFMAYLSLGVLYSDVNKYVRDHLTTQLHNLDISTSKQKIRKLQNRLDKCLYLYREIYNISISFQRLFVLPLFLTLINKVVLVAMIGIRMIIDFSFSGIVFWTLIIKHTMDLLLLTISAQGALNQFRIIRRPNLEIGKAGDLKEFRTTLEIFYIHLNLCQFRVCILGLCDVSNELFLIILSALATWLSFVAQYRMQMKTIHQSQDHPGSLAILLAW
ncbi:putative gustatory receptor 92a [Drosophila eugracilis]|uniref:putative gustatory receptor 92a n=1 Tax=Drosophila eugracilis TaxID=29029 RepID=UPI001BDA4C5F|nr:putative gustatory receptor 92a [Drosophila eugracilis]